MLSEEQGKILVGLARKAVDSSTKGAEFTLPPGLAPELMQPRGAFVTLLARTGPGEPLLRGCTGSSLPGQAMAQAVVRAAQAACRDPRFQPVSPDELDRLLIEVSVLTEPERISVDSPLEYPTKIRVGEDGVIIQWRGLQALLLPQVAPQEKWNAEDLLCGACLKAGAPPDCWLDGAIVYKFRAEVFAEREPGGNVDRIRY